VCAGSVTVSACSGSAAVSSGGTGRFAMVNRSIACATGISTSTPSGWSTVTRTSSNPLVLNTLRRFMSAA
jgi:hypothetical protein